MNENAKPALKKWRRGMGGRKVKRQADRLAEIARDRRRDQVYELYGQGMTTRKIAAELGISKAQVCRDLVTITQETSSVSRAEQRAKLTARLDFVAAKIAPLVEAGEQGKERTVAERCSAARTIIREVAVNARINGAERPIQVELAPVGMRDAYDDLVSSIADESEEQTTH